MDILSILSLRLAHTTLEICRKRINSTRNSYTIPRVIDRRNNIDSVGSGSVDNQQIFNIIVSVAAFLAVYVFNNMTRQIQKLEDKVNEMPHTYVQKDDYRADIAEIKSILKQIFEKLDSKADK